jgi:tetratricopeptide (TPR) repeat protein
VVYPLLRENTEYLNQNLAEVLRHLVKNLLAEVETEIAQSISGYIVNLSNLIQQFPSGDKASNMEIAIAGYETVLTIFTRTAFPQDWAMTQNNLGNAYSDRILGDKAENIELAIAAYTNALEVRTRTAFPQNHAETLFNLGILYQEARRLSDAYTTYQAAIETVEFLRGKLFLGVGLGAGAIVSGVVTQHIDKPFAPISVSNPLHPIVSSLFWSVLATLFFGALAWLWARRRR